MPSVFLSHSKEDLPTIEQLESQLTSHPEIAIWRDQEKIYGEQKWPRILGEAIADQDVFLLAWSKNAASSQRVEFEWRAALALNKPIVPYLMDDTAVPVSLRTDRVIPVNDLPKLVSTLTSANIYEDRGSRAEVIRKLDQITAGSSHTVLESVTTLLNQSTGMVQGHVIQAESVTVHIGQERERSTSGSMERWGLWIGIFAGLITIAGLVVDFPKSFESRLPSMGTSSTTKLLVPEKPTPQVLIGAIRNEANEPLADVQVALPQFTLTQTTDQFGQFHFKVTASEQKTVALLARKPGYQTYEADVTLGNPVLGFTMRKKP